MMLRFVKNGLLIGLLLLASSNNASESKSAARPTVDSLPDRIFGQSGLMRMAAGGAGGPVYYVPVVDVDRLEKSGVVRRKRGSILSKLEGDDRHGLYKFNFYKDNERSAYVFRPAEIETYKCTDGDPNVLQVKIDLCCTMVPNKIDKIYISDHNTLVGFSYTGSAKSLLPSLDQVDNIVMLLDPSAAPIEVSRDDVKKIKAKEPQECILLKDKKGETYNTGIELKLADPVNKNIKTWAFVSSFDYGLGHLFKEKLYNISRNPIVEHCSACHALKNFTDLSKCSRCESAFYCNRDCQKKGWNAGHKAACRK